VKLRNDFDFTSKVGGSYMMMRKRKYDLAVAYRMYPRLSGKPAFYHEKWDLARDGVFSFRQSLNGLRAKLWAILDGCPDSYEAFVRSIFPSSDLTVIREPGIGNQKTFAKQVELLRTQNEAELVYFAEDDYLYQPEAMTELVDFHRTNSHVHYSSPYDHPGYYDGPNRLPLDRHTIRFHGRRHWRTAVCNTCTFLTSSDVLQQDWKTINTYSQHNSDMGMWMSLTRRFILSPSFLLRGWRGDRLMLRIWSRCWRLGWKSNLLGPSRMLWSPMPALATHLEGTFLAPGCNWHGVHQHAQALREMVNLIELP
jgi:hypothetical protein